MARQKRPYQDMCGYTANGEEILDSRPVEMMLNKKPPESLQSMVARLVRNAEHQRNLDKAGFETWEESNDFDCDDDFDPSTPYEQLYEVEAMIKAEADAARAEQAEMKKLAKLKAEKDAKGSKKVKAQSSPTQAKLPPNVKKKPKQVEVEIVDEDE